MRALLSFGWLVILAVGPRAQEAVEIGTKPSVRRALAIEGTGRSGRTVVMTDAVLAQLARGIWVPPRAGDVLETATGDRPQWREIRLAADGGVEGSVRGGGWCWIEFDHPRDETLLLDAPGCSFVYAGGEPRMADMYALGNMRTPVALKTGANPILARVARGRPRFVWSSPVAPIALDLSDTTMPDLLFGSLEQPSAEPPEVAPAPTTYLGALVATNATTERIEGLRVATRVDDGPWKVDVTPLTLLSLETRKIAISFDAAVTSRTAGVLQVELRDEAGRALHRVESSLPVRSARAAHRRTFVSDIDGSVQYYGLVPSTVDSADDLVPGLILTLHGASVEAWGQASAYTPKTWAHIVAPTNRRPYGFDWEDWGRLDALEVLADAETLLRFDPRRRSLTGHSMGGHGTWNLGVLRSDLFAAIAPSAGWIDFWRYTAGEEPEAVDPIDVMLRRAANPSRTLLLARNLAPRGVYVLHGDADDNVPVGQARRMREELAKFHPDFAYYERRDAGHWWGNECVDWPPLMEFLRSHRLPEDPNSLEFTTVDLDIRDRERWLVIEGTQRRMEPATVAATFDPARSAMRITTDNVSRLALDLTDSTSPFLSGAQSTSTTRLAQFAALTELAIEIDGQALAVRQLVPSIPSQTETSRPSSGTTSENTVDVDANDANDAASRKESGTVSANTGVSALGNVLRLSRAPTGAWAAAADDAIVPARPSVTFKSAFRRRFALVYGTGGTPEENAWALAKARFDAEQFRYRGNASPTLLSDVEWLASNGVAAGIVAPAPGVPHATPGEERQRSEGVLREGPQADGLSASLPRNVVLYGNADTHRAWSRLVPDGRLEVRRGFVRIGERKLQGDDLVVLAALTQRAQSGARPAASNDPPRVAIVAGSGPIGLRVTTHLPYFVSGAGFPDWLVLRTEMLERGLDGIEGAGFFDETGGLGASSESAWRAP